MRKIQTAMSSDLCIRLTRNLTGSAAAAASNRDFVSGLVWWKTIPRWRTAAILKIDQLNSTHSLMRKDLTGHTGPNSHLHMPIIKLKKDKQNKHAKFMVTRPHGRQQHYLAVF